jgi:hypothetical protein
MAVFPAKHTVPMGTSLQGELRPLAPRSPTKSGGYMGGHWPAPVKRSFSFFFLQTILLWLCHRSEGAKICGSVRNLKLKRAFREGERAPKDNLASVNAHLHAPFLFSAVSSLALDSTSPMPPGSSRLYQQIAEGV